jgi:hypothetical protein
MVMLKNQRTSVSRLGPIAHPHSHNPAKVPNFIYKAYDGGWSVFVWENFKRKN